MNEVKFNPFKDLADAGKTPEAIQEALDRRSKRNNISIVINGYELNKINEFENKHDELHGTYAGAIAGRYTYMITRTSIGNITCVKCGQCGDREDVTEYDSW